MNGVLPYIRPNYRPGPDPYLPLCNGKQNKKLEELEILWTKKIVAMRKLVSLFLLVILSACSFKSEAPEQTTTLSEEQLKAVPKWAQSAIWYQIFPERFYNGDHTNDPRKEDIVGSYPGAIPENWQTTAWTAEWHLEDPWMKELKGTTDFTGNPVTSLNQKVQMRRYGGDLAGVLAKLDYLDSLGVTAIYFNPLNDAPSLHKYDARNWRHIDRNFGPNPDGDAALMAQEDPADPETWIFTEADSLFLQIIEEIHQRGMRLILDYSWNHTGVHFWAWQDILKSQAESNYADWYWVEAYDDPKTDSNEFSYNGWFSLPELPEIKDTPYVDHTKVVSPFEGQVQSADARQHIYAISKRWLDPNGDGDPRDGVDGFRLDVAAEMPLGFWRDYRREVRSVNPDAFLLGEVWWEEWPDKLIDPQPYLQGDIFDGVMNYRWFRSLRRHIAAAPDSMPASALRDSLQAYANSASRDHQRAWMNMSASHDAPRLATALFNRNAYKVGTGRDNVDYQIHKPDQAARIRQILFLHTQFTMPGAPQIYNGDEMGMWGEDDPGNRKPLIWPEFDFEAERSYPFAMDLKYDLPQFDQDLFKLYQKLIALRKGEEIWSAGRISFPELENQGDILVYDRVLEGDTLRCVLNATAYPQDYSGPGTLEEAYTSGQYDYQRIVNQVPPLSFGIFRL